MTPSKLLPLLFSLVAPLACGGEPESVDDFFDNGDRYARAICECDHGSLLLVFFSKTPYASREACLADLPPNSAERGCAEGLFRDTTVDYSSILDCRAGALGRAAGCLNSLTCTDTMRLECHGTLTDEYDACADLPADVESKLNDCLYN